MKAMRMVAVLLMMALLILTGCGQQSSAPKAPEPSSAPTASDQPAAAAPAKEMINISLAVGGTKNSMIFLVPVFAEYNKFFQEEGINLTIQELKGGAQAAQALVAGEVDFASMAVEHAIKSKAQGVDLTMVSLHTRYPTVTLVVDSKLKDKVKSVADLKGMKVGITSPGSGSHKALLSLLDKHGLKPTDVEIVGVGTSGMPAALESGQIQASANYDPYITEVTSSGKAFVLWDLRTEKDTVALYGSEYPFVSMVTRTDMIQKKPDVVERVVRAVNKANKFLSSNSAETITAKLPVEVKGTNEALYLAALRANLEALSPDGIASEKGLQVVIDSLKAEGAIPASTVIKPADFYNASFSKK